jgi:hypothetical protein
VGAAGTTAQRLDPAANASYQRKTAALPHGLKKITVLFGPRIKP